MQQKQKSTPAHKPRNLLWCPIPLAIDTDETPDLHTSIKQTKSKEAAVPV